ncbi:hypothetical protein PCH_Pc22g19460 [Penicillium rubens Wisconsin 54-1255]|uniref:Uncharacterized protein n=1 Tax=Penicillium rubens (strain ATCC 28089 / DSM 1075 / NRRL 1951 / Wisconsin 54-1255) TaxID=500485 RepID=B6HW14_PENRW|nr:hypothetical protein PCH_Pc22g19460 [Penicillium rubens Wisconsin 54-1255]
MARLPQNIHPAASSTELPTLRSTPVRRSITSYSMPCRSDPLLSSFGNTTDVANDETRDYHYQVKATLTNILNDDLVACRGYCWKTNKTCGNSEDIHSARVLLSDYLKCTSSTRINVHASLHFHQGKRSLVDCFSLWQTSHNVLLCLDRD